MAGDRVREREKERERFGSSCSLQSSCLCTTISSTEAHACMHAYHREWACSYSPPSLSSVSPFFYIAASSLMRYAYEAVNIVYSRCSKPASQLALDRTK